MSKLQEVNPADYKDYCSARKVSRTSHKEGIDTAVMGLRPKLDLPYWIHKAMCRGGYNNPWSWVFEHGGARGPNANTTRFGQMFPEFLILNGDENEVKELKRQRNKEKDSHLWQSYELAVKYLADRLKHVKEGGAV